MSFTNKRWDSCEIPHKGKMQKKVAQNLRYHKNRSPSKGNHNIGIREEWNNGFLHNGMMG